MSDQSPAATPATPNPAVANATQALAIKELGETVAGVKKQVKTLWISFAVLAVVVVVLAVMTFVPSLRFGLAGRSGFTRGNFGTTNGSTFVPGGGTGGAPGGTNGGSSTTGQ
jgi:uncharacterized membrane protein